MFPLKKKRKNTIEKKLKLKIRIKIRANLLSVNWTIQFPGSGENNCSRPSSKIESLSLYISLRWLARGFIGFRGRAAPSFFQVAARSREVASSSIIRLRPSHLTNVSVRFHIAAFSSFPLRGSSIPRGFLILIPSLSLSREWKRRCPGNFWIASFLI